MRRYRIVVTCAFTRCLCHASDSKLASTVSETVFVARLPSDQRSAYESCQPKRMEDQLISGAPIIRPPRAALFDPSEACVPVAQEDTLNIDVHNIMVIL